MITNNPKISIDQLVFKSLYYRYKAFITPLACIVICLLLFYFVVLPQIQSFFALQDALSVDRQNLALLQQNLQTITRLNDASLAKNLELATSALPAEKDFAGIVNALQLAGAKAGVIVGDYAIPLGDLSGADAKNTGKSGGQLPIQMNVSIKGSPKDAQKFIHELKSQLPLSDVIAVNGGSSQSIIVTILFYFAPLPKIVFKDDAPLPTFGNADAKILTDLASGQDTTNTAPLAPSSTPTPSPSGSGAQVVPTKVASQSAQ